MLLGTSSTGPWSPLLVTKSQVLHQVRLPAPRAKKRIFRRLATNSIASCDRRTSLATGGCRRGRTWPSPHEHDDGQIIRSTRVGIPLGDARRAVLPRDFGPWILRRRALLGSYLGRCSFNRGCKANLCDGPLVSTFADGNPAVSLTIGVLGREAATLRFCLLLGHWESVARGKAHAVPVVFAETSLTYPALPSLRAGRDAIAMDVDATEWEPQPAKR